jgi:predicted HTH transcriptional regulator
LGLECDRDDVIRSGTQGYRLHEWIRLEGEDKTSPQIVADEEPNRRDQILKMLSGGKRLRTTAIAASLGCSQATAKRELDVLRNDEVIEFIGPSKTGGYQLRKVMSE